MTSVILNAVKNLPEGWFPAERMLLYYQVRRFCLSWRSFAGLLRITKLSLRWSVTTAAIPLLNGGAIA